VHDGSLTTPSATRRRALVEAVRRSRRGPNDPASGELNTTLVIVTTDAVIDGTEATRIATVAQDGLARAIRPVHSLFDGDTVFTLSTGRVPLTGESRPGDLNLLSAAAADCAALACTDAVISAEAHSGAPSYTELTGRATRG
jgi:L-aminopeptidase/D-esterase-like protein